MFVRQSRADDGDHGDGTRWRVAPVAAVANGVVAFDTRTVAVLHDHRRRQVAERLTAGPVWSAELQDQDLVFTCPDGTPSHPNAPPSSSPPGRRRRPTAHRRPRAPTHLGHPRAAGRRPHQGRLTTHRPRRPGGDHVGRRPRARGRQRHRRRAHRYRHLRRPASTRGTGPDPPERGAPRPLHRSPAYEAGSDGIDGTPPTGVGGVLDRDAPARARHQDQPAR
jgi:hypothetical protein